MDVFCWEKSHVSLCNQLMDLLCRVTVVGLAMVNLWVHFL